MAPQMKQLPWELVEDVLSRLPPQSLIRFRSVCKRWNSVFNDKSFLNNHLSRSRPQFILLTNSKVYSIDIIDLDSNSIYPRIELRELPSSYIPYHTTFSLNYTIITAWDEVLFLNYQLWNHENALWNPWLRQVKFMENKDKYFSALGLGYDNSRPEKFYKILGYFNCRSTMYKRFAIYECASYTLKVIGLLDEYWPITVSVIRSTVSLNGNLYWVTCNLETHEYLIRSFDFSRENFKPFCLLPCQKNHNRDELILAVYKGDRLSLLKQDYETRKIEVWVTKKNIDREEEEVVWINLMTLPTTNLPTLSCKFDENISYFIYQKTLVMCCSCNENGVACIYIVREDLFKKIQIDNFRVFNSCHCVYTPSLISFPLFRG